MRETAAPAGGVSRDAGSTGAPVQSVPAGTPARDVSTSSVLLETIVLTELVATDSLAQSLGEAGAEQAVDRHDQLVRDLLHELGGREIDKSAGFLQLFVRPLDAVRYALAYHDRLARLSTQLGVKLGGRVGIHFGEVFAHENTPADVARGAKPIEVEGLAKPIAARVMSLAEAGQTLLTQSAFELSQRASVGVFDDGRKLRWLAHGSYLFKGLDEPLPVFEVGIDGIAPLRAPRGSAKARRSGRRRLVRWAVPAVIALAVLAALAVRFGPRAKRSEIRPSVAVLGLKNLSGRADDAWMSTAVAEMLSIELAATERLRTLPGQSIARMKRELSLAEAETLDDETLSRVRENLDTDYVVAGSYLLLNATNGGGRQLQLSVALQDSRLGGTLTTFSADGTEDQLFGLVSRAGGALLSKLDVGAAPAGAAEAVQAALSADQRATRLYAEGLTQLRSLNAIGAQELLEQAVELDPGYAVAHAALAEAWSTLGYDKRAVDSARLAFENGQELPREEVLSIEGRMHEVGKDWHEAIDTYQALWAFFPDNLDYGLRLAQAQISAGLADDSLATVAAMRRIADPARPDPRIELIEAEAMDLLGDYNRLLRLTEAAARQAAAQQAWTLVAEAEIERAWALRQLGRIEETKASLDEARRLFAESGDRSRVARVMNLTAILLKNEGSYERAEELYAESLVIQREIGSRGNVAALLNNLGNLNREKGVLAKAEALLGEALQVAREIDRQPNEASFRSNLSLVLQEQGRLDEAERLARQSLAETERIGQRVLAAWGAHSLGRILLDRGRIAEARQVLEEALAAGEEIGIQRQISYVLHDLSLVQIAQGELSEAEAASDRARAIRARLGGEGMLAESGLAQALLLLEQDKLEDAERLGQEVRAEFERQGRATDAAAAAAIVAEALRRHGRVTEARQLIVAHADRAAASETPRVRLGFAIVDAHLRAAEGDVPAAMRTLDRVTAEAADLGLLGIELQAQLVAAGLAPGGIGRARFEDVAARALANGFELTAAKAELGARSTVAQIAS